MWRSWIGRDPRRSEGNCLQTQDEVFVSAFCFGVGTASFKTHVTHVSAKVGPDGMWIPQELHAPEWTNTVDSGAVSRLTNISEKACTKYK